MTRYFIAAVLILLAGYGFMEAWPLIAGPSLSITSPANNASLPGGQITIAGTATRAAQVTLDGEALLHDQQGRFSSTLTFPRGGSILTFTATDRFGRTVTVTRSIFVPY
ncbi:MAG: Ig-like domain-containing protein [Minisyncoccia bacterium]